ncbi:hypothetical protein [Streptomyces sp. NPDC047000]|uniref:hypothetical protein n=1 Tax=Streptomyces sp. NPDC047000 TaxID=3155474 RepID=UPI0033F3681E
MSAHRISFVVLLQAAADQIVTGHGARLDEPVDLVAVIGRAALADLPPEARRRRLKARVRKRQSKYSFNRNLHTTPRTAQKYTLHAEVIKNSSP